MTSERPTSWDVRPLAECGVWLSGGTPSKARREYWGGAIPWVGPKDLHVRYVDSAEESLTPEGVKRGSRLAPPSTILVVVRSMALGKALQISFTRREVAFNQDIKAIIPGEGIDPRFLFYAMWGTHDSLHALVDEASHGTKRLRTDVLGAFRMPLPSIGEQRRIVSVLAALDDKIDSNRRLATPLEEIAVAFFRARFVDFVGVEAFEEGEIAPIPAGWKVVPIGQVLKIVGGGTPSTKEPNYWEGGTHCWATPKDLSGHDSPVLLGTARHVTDAGLKRISSGILPPDTVLLSSRAPVGYTVISKVPIAVNQGFIAIPPSGDIPSEYVLFWLRHNMDKIKANAGGTTFAEISKRAFRPIPMLVPPKQQLNEFGLIVQPILSLIAGLDRERLALVAVRDALLPKLISGEIRVPDTVDSKEVIGSAVEQLAGAKA
jgi:type I restriction enzyme, S subunit